MADLNTWFYGPNGEAEIFHDAADVPAGWLDHPNNPENPDNKHGKPAKAPRVPATPADARALLTDEGGELPNNVMKLRAIAKHEETDLGTATKAADIKALILAARAEKAG